MTEVVNEIREEPVAGKTPGLLTKGAPFFVTKIAQMGVLSP